MYIYERREMLLYRDITTSVMHDSLYENGSDSDETRKTGREPSADKLTASEYITGVSYNLAERH